MVLEKKRKSFEKFFRTKEVEVKFYLELAFFFFNRPFNKWALGVNVIIEYSQNLQSCAIMSALMYTAQSIKISSLGVQL